MALWLCAPAWTRTRGDRRVWTPSSRLWDGNAPCPAWRDGEMRWDWAQLNATVASTQNSYPSKSKDVLNVFAESEGHPNNFSQSFKVSGKNVRPILKGIVWLKKWKVIEVCMYGTFSFFLFDCKYNFKQLYYFGSPLLSGLCLEKKVLINREAFFLCRGTVWCQSSRTLL